MKVLLTLDWLDICLFAGATMQTFDCWLPLILPQSWMSVTSLDDDMVPCVLTIFDSRL